MERRWRSSLCSTRTDSDSSHGWAPARQKPPAASLFVRTRSSTMTCSSFQIRRLILVVRKYSRRPELRGDFASQGAARRHAIDCAPEQGATPAWPAHRSFTRRTTATRPSASRRSLDRARRPVGGHPSRMTRYGDVCRTCVSKRGPFSRRELDDGWAVARGWLPRSCAYAG